MGLFVSSEVARLEIERSAPLNQTNETPIAFDLFHGMELLPEDVFHITSSAYKVDQRLYNYIMHILQTL